MSDLNMLGTVNKTFETDVPRGSSASDFAAAGPISNAAEPEEGKYFPEASSEAGLSDEESIASVDEDREQQVEEETRQSRYLGAAQSQEGTQGMAAMAAVGAVGSGGMVLPDATRAREDPWLKPPPPEQPGALQTLPEYPSHEDLVGIELQERERMEQMQEDAEMERSRRPSQHSTAPPVWRKQGEDIQQQQSPFATGEQQQQQSAGAPAAHAPSDAVTIQVAQEPEKPSSAAPVDGAGGDTGKDGGPSEAMVKDQHAQLLAKLPEDEQMVLEFRDICSYAVLGGMGAQAKFNMFLGKLDPFDWDYSYLHPAKLGRMASSRSATLKRALGRSFRGTGTAGADASAGAPGVGQGSKSWLPMALRRRRAEAGGSPGGAREGDVEEGKGKGPAAAAGKPGKKGKKGDKAKKQILFNITGRVLPGQVLALMGPSGSGKTSLLAVLGGRTPPRIKLEGQILVNGERSNKASRKRIGFVLQDDVLYETLTVYETLMYAGMLRLPRTMSKTEKIARVEAVMKVLGLTRSRDTIIGGFFRRGVSGGERKRVSVGHELLINPAVLLLDEPTSGLDSTTALHLVNLLRDLASAGRAILTTIHQPSSRLYRQLDQVMLLSEGHPMYYGDALRAADWFAHLGFGLPYGTNLADHILDCAMGEVTYDPSAPGAAAASQTQGPVCGAPYIHGGVAVRCLYTTFEMWYEEHPGGFSLGPTDFRNRQVARNEHEERLQKAGMARQKDQVDKLLENVRLALPPSGSFTGMRHSQQLVRPADTPRPTASLALQGSNQLAEGAEAAGDDAKSGSLHHASSQPLRSRRTSTSVAVKHTDDHAVRQGLLSGRPKSVDLEWNGGAARGGGRASKDLGGMSRLPLVGRLLGGRGSIEAAEAEGHEGRDKEGASSSSSGGGPQELLRVLQTPAPGQEGQQERGPDAADKACGKGGASGKPGAMDVEKVQPQPQLQQNKAASKVMDATGQALSLVGINIRKEKGPPDMGALWPMQLYILWSRALKVRRFESLTGQQLFQLFAVSIITGLLWWQRGRTNDISAGQDIQGLLFFELLFPSFRSLFSALFTFPNEFRMLSKERPSGMYKLSAYYWARVGADLPLELALPTMFVIIVYWFGGLRATAGAFFSNWASLMLVITLAQSWGLLIGGVCMDPKQAQTVTTVIMLTFLLVGGFYVRDVPVWIGWIKYFSFIYWGNNLLMKIEFGNRSFVDKSEPGNPEVTDLESALNLQVNPDIRIWEEVVVLLAMLIILRWLTYLTLRWKTSTSQKSL